MPFIECLISYLKLAVMFISLAEHCEGLKLLQCCTDSGHLKHHVENDTSLGIAILVLKSCPQHATYPSQLVNIDSPSLDIQGHLHAKCNAEYKKPCHDEQCLKWLAEERSATVADF